MISLTADAEHLELSYAEKHTPLAMLSMIAPASEAAARQPLEVIAVVDRSGSMRGEKMDRMRSTLSFLVEKGLQSDDSCDHPPREFLQLKHEFCYST